MPARRLLLSLFALSVFCRAQSAPPWTRALPVVPGRIYAMGTATVAPSEAKALEQAAQNARFELIARLRVGVSGSTTVSETLSQQQTSGAAAVGSRQLYVRQDGTTSVQAADLPGLVVEERYLDRKAGAAYALAYLDAAVAERTLADRVGALESDWKALQAEPGPQGLRPAITRLQKVKALQARATELEAQASLLIPAGVPASHRADIQTLSQGLTRAAAGIQKGLTVGASVQGGDLAQDVLALLRNTALRQGFVWTQKDPAMTLRIDLRGTRQGLDIHSRTWWEVDASRADLVGTRARIRVSLVDANGDDQDSFDLSVKGVGVDPFSSEQAFLKELKKVLPAKFQEFLIELVK